MAIVNQISYHGYILQVLTIVLLNKLQDKSCVLMFLLTATLFSKNIQGNFNLILPFKQKLKSQKLLPITLNNIN